MRAETLEPLGRAYRESPTPQNRAKLKRFAASHSKDSLGARALLALGATDFERKAFAEALPNLESAQRRLPKLADYTAYLIASSQSGLQKHSEAVQALEPLWTASPKSPLLANSVLLAARSHLAMQQPKQASDLLRKHLPELPEAPAHLLLGSAAEAAGDDAGAVSHYQTVFHNQPDSP
ncbi:MAG: tetratricopeptide repeat protein, partial [Bryobacteraceae bacterium]